MVRRQPRRNGRIAGAGFEMKSLILGLTGSIGSGKSTASKMLREKVLPVFDADAAVHRIMRDNGRMKEYFAAKINGSVVNGEISRSVLSEKIKSGELDVHRLEQMIWPFAEEELHRFFERHSHEPLIILDVPLLFEAGWDGYCDKIIVMTAPEEVLSQRVLARPKMTREKYLLLKQRQMSDKDKCEKADYVIDSSAGIEAVRNRLDEITDELSCAR